MTPVYRVKVAWTNFPGAPGLSVHYLKATTIGLAPLTTFYTAIKQLMPLNLTFQIPNSGDILTVEDGKIGGTWSASGGGTAASSAGSGAYSGSSGSMVRWQTAGIVAGQRVQGRTYLVPGAPGIYFTDGSLAGATQTTVETAAAALITAYGGDLVVYARPFKGRAATPGGAPAIPARDGSIHQITSAICPDLAVVMRSRRI